MASNNPDVPAANKRFVPLENNPEVMDALTHTLGLSSTLAFHDIFSIDDPALLSFVPRPALALILIFPVTETYERHRRDEDGQLPEYTGSGPSEPVAWFRQTIGNACGFMGLLHATTNGTAREQIMPGSDLDKLLREAIPLAPAERAQLLYDSKAVETAHQSAAQTGQSAAPDASDLVDLHFVTFVKGQDGHLWEMDGRRKGPLDRGTLPDGEDVLGEEALNRSVRKFIGRENDLRFSLVALAPSLD